MSFSPIVAVAVAALLLLAGVLVGAWVASRGRRGAIEAQRDEFSRVNSDNQRLVEQVSAARIAAGSSDATASAHRERAASLEMERDRLSGEKQSAENRAAIAETQLADERRKSDEKLALLDEARERLAKDFEIVAGKILEDKSTRFTAQNRTNLEQLLRPFETQLTDFRKKVEEVQAGNLVQSTRLEVQHTELLKMNSQLALEASNLSRALRSSPGLQGRFGEEILDRLLEVAGLHEGLHYRKQAVLKGDDGGRPRPDIILDLPGDRHIVIDAKMSLKDYNDYHNAESEQARDLSIAAHLRSVRNHLDGLSVKSYHTLHSLNSLDFVVLFMPIEPAFALAIARDEKLWSDAWEKNVLLVSPTSLLFVVRTVANLWRQEQQVQNVKEIVARGGALYDKFAGFVTDLKEIGEGLENARESYDQAMGKLTTGSGNLVRQVEMLRQLGVTPKGKKGRLPPDILGAALQDEMFTIAAAAEEADLEASES